MVILKTVGATSIINNHIVEIYLGGQDIQLRVKNAPIKLINKLVLK